MRFTISLAAAGLGAALLAGCETYDAGHVPAGGTSTTTVVRDAYGNPVAGGTTVRDAYGNPVAGGTTVRDSYGRPIAAAPAYPAPPPYQSGPVYSGSSYPPPAYQDPIAVGRAQSPDCRATALHQDRPGGSDYNPYRGAPSC
jgi:hypothetical protein